MDQTQHSLCIRGCTFDEPSSQWTKLQGVTQEKIHQNTQSQVKETQLNLSVHLKGDQLDLA